MVTYSDLIQIGILIVGIIGLIIQANNKKKEVTAPLHVAVTSCNYTRGQTVAG